MRVEVRATGLKAMRQQNGLTQQELRRELGLSQNYICWLESGAGTPGPKVQRQLMDYFGCDFEKLFEVFLVDPETRRETRLSQRRI